MRIGRSFASLAIAILALAVVDVGTPQSLGEAARKEKERREKSGDSGRAMTNDDLAAKAASPRPTPFVEAEAGRRTVAATPDLLFLDSNGEELFAPMVSQPVPMVTLRPVTLSDIQVLGPNRVRIHLSGDVTDPLADIVGDHLADITVVTVHEQPIPVRRVDEAPSAARPFAFRGRFDARVELPLEWVEHDIVSVEARNAVGNKGWATFEIHYEQAFEMPKTIDVSAPLSDKFLDPFTLVLPSLRPDAVDSLVFIHGNRTQSAADKPLVETGAGTLVFKGRTGDLEGTTLMLTGQVPRTIAGQGRAVSAQFESDGLSISGQTEELFEIEPGSGIFRSNALRLPSNQVMQVRLDARFDAGRTEALQVRLGSWKAFAGLDPKGFDPESSLKRTRPGVFEGVVSGLGRTTIEVVGTNANPVRGQGGLVVLLSSEALKLSRYRLELLDWKGDGQNYQCLDWHVGGIIEMPTAVPPPARMISVTPPKSGPDQMGRWWPFWVVLRGAKTIGPNDRGLVDKQPFELTTDPLPFARDRGAEVRFRLPLVLVANPRQLRAANVLPAFEEPPSPLRTAKGPKVHSFEIDRGSGTK